MLSSLLAQHNITAKKEVLCDIELLECFPVYSSELRLESSCMASEITENVFDTLVMAQKLCEADDAASIKSGLALVKIAANNAKLVGLDLEVPAGESFDTDPEETMRLAGEGLGSKVKDVTRYIINAIKQLIKNTKVFFIEHFGAVKKLEKTLESHESKYLPVEGKADDNAVVKGAYLQLRDYVHQKPASMSTLVKNLNLVKDFAAELKNTVKDIGDPDLVIALPGLSKIGGTTAEGHYDEVRYEKEMYVILVGGMHINSITPKYPRSYSQKITTTRSKSVLGKVDKEHPVLSAKEIQEYMDFSKECLELAKDFVAIGEDAASKASKHLEVLVKELDDLSIAEKPVAKLNIKLFNTTVSNLAVITKALSKYSASQGTATLKFAVASAKQYK